MMDMAVPMESKQPERSASVQIVTNMVRDLMRKICDVDGIENQQNMLMQLFAFLWSVKSLDECAQKLTALAMQADKIQTDEEKQDMQDEQDLSKWFASLYIEQK